MTSTELRNEISRLATLEAAALKETDKGQFTSLRARRNTYEAKLASK